MRLTVAAILIVCMPVLAETKGLLVGKVFLVKVDYIEISSNSQKPLSAGMRLIIESSTGAIPVIVKEVYHTKVKAMGDKNLMSRISRGDAAFVAENNTTEGGGKKIMSGPDENESETERYK